MWLTRVSIHNPIFAAMMMLALLVLGVFSYQRLPVEEFPDAKFPVVSVNTTYPGASPEIVESDISRKVEEAIAAVSGVKKLHSSSYQNLSVVVAEFELTVDPERAVQEVREKVAIVKRSFRKEVEEPLISRYNPQDRPILTVVLASNKHSLRDLTLRADQYLKKQYQAVQGVGSVSLVGGVKREINVSLNPSAMMSLGIGVDQVVAALRSDNQEWPAGAVETGTTEKTLRLVGRMASPEDFTRLVIARRGEGAVTLGQVASVEDGTADRTSAAMVNGKPALTIDIVKIQGGNTIEVADRVRKLTQMLSTQLEPEGIHLSVINDASTGVRNALGNVRDNLLEGALLTVVIVFLFLGSWRSTVITGLTLPVALVGTFLFLHVAGFTVNVMTLMALSLCVGLLIDDAIVVRENIVRHAALGKDARQSALDGTREIALAVLATTLSIVAVFLPVGFMGGIIGRFFFQFGLTVTAAVLISMLVSFTLDPMLSSVWHDPTVHGVHGGRGWIARTLAWFSSMLDRLAGWYVDMIAWCLRHRGRVLLVALASLIGAVVLVVVVGGEFVPQADMSRVQIRFDTAEGSTLDYTEAKARHVDAALREFAEVREVYANINAGSATGTNAVSLDVGLVPRAGRRLNVTGLIPLFRDRIKRIGGVALKGIVTPDGPVGNAKPIYLSIQGPELSVLKSIAAKVTQKMATIPGIVDLDSSFKEAKPTLDVELNREMAIRLGLASDHVATALRVLVAGEAATTWKAPDGENYDVLVRVPKGERSSTPALANLPVAGQAVDTRTGRPIMVPLVQVATIHEGVGPTQINRRAMFKEIALTASLDHRPLGEVAADVQALANSIHLPTGYRFDLGGASKDMSESAGYAVSALVLAVLFIYMVLASQFGSLLQPMVIMTSLPLSLVGVMLGLLIGRSTLNIFSVIGVIMLMGLVTKNAILLVDFVNRMRSIGMPREVAIAEAGRVRMRPILMTTASMVFGMLPLALSMGEGAEQRAPMAHAIIGGIISSTILTLVVVPVVFTYLDDFGAWVKCKVLGAGRSNGGLEDEVRQKMLADEVR